MELSPQSVASTTFRTVKKGYDPDEVRAYLSQLATAIESTQAQAAAMEARARAAVARLQEIAAQPPAAAAPVEELSQRPVDPTPAGASRPLGAVDEAETISRTLLLAQRTADQTGADAEAEARRIRDDAEAEAQAAIEAARETHDRMVEEAKAEARQAGEGARIEVESEVQALLARREFLLSDVDHLEQHVAVHRERIRDVAFALNDLVDNSNTGLAEMRRPLMSAVTADAVPARDTADDGGDPTMAMAQVPRSSGPATVIDEQAPDIPERRSGDRTPAFGGELPFISPDEPTGEVEVISHPDNDAFPKNDEG